MPEFVRTAWGSDEARDYWDPKIRAVSQVWPLVERATVLQTLRPGALQSVGPEQVPELQQWSLRHEIPMAIIALEGAHESYGNATTPYRPGAPFTYRVYLGKDPAAFLEAWQDSDNAAIGAMLGFPVCCAAFFDRYWRKGGWRDLTALLAMPLPEATNTRYTNVLLKQLGVRPVFHLPCSFTCQPTREVGEDIRALMDTLGYQQEALWSDALLSMPMEWTSLHGVAMVVTPILKLVYASDPLPTKATLRVVSDAYPMYGARGNTFPFETVTPVPLVMKKQCLNGFTTRAAMQRGHQFVLDMLPPDLHGSVLDLGCGDGALLRAIRERHPYTELHGVEQRTDLLHGYDVGDLFTWQWTRDYRLVLVALQRLEETESTTVLRLLNHIADHTETLLLYSYDGWRTDVSDLIRQRFWARKHTHDRDANLAASLCEPLGGLHDARGSTGRTDTDATNADRDRPDAR